MNRATAAGVRSSRRLLLVLDRNQDSLGLPRRPHRELLRVGANIRRASPSGATRAPAQSLPPTGEVVAGPSPPSAALWETERWSAGRGRRTVRHLRSLHSLQHDEHVVRRVLPGL